MRDFHGKTYWLIGASAGLGAELARGLSKRGAHLILSARDEESLRQLADSLDGPAEIAPLDVSDPASIDAAAATFGVPDGLVYLAGVYWPLSAAEWNPDQVEAMADINFSGALRCLGRVLPQMIARDAGHIVITGSLSGFRGLPGSLGYGASKAACMYLAESLHADLAGTGVDVQLVNPGFIRTRLTDKNDFTMPFIMEPGEAAALYLRHMETQRFTRNFPRVFSWAFRLSRLLPDSLYYRFFTAATAR
ncbi:MAG: SDR family NAD(P)-dependent oxidoreductase [Mangrovicoccus sp.]